MSIEIKFRLYDKLEKRMIYLVGYCWESKNMLRFWYKGDDEQLLNESIAKWNAEVIPGLVYKDYGKTIYSGDVVELFNEDNELIKAVCEFGIARRTVQGQQLVEVDIPSFYFKLTDTVKTFPVVQNYANKHDMELFKVIGNIYENPMLWKKQQ